MSETEDDVPEKKQHYLGHRHRLRERLFRAGAEALQDYELLEMLLFAALPRRDVKPLAKALLDHFKDLWALLRATPAQLQAFGLSEATAALLAVTGAIALRAQKGVIMQRPMLSNWQKIVDYCLATLSAEPKEQCRLLFFDRRNNLIHEEIHQKGTIDHTPLYAREVVQRALEVGAGALVIVHNHPSGDTTPSKADIDMTRAIKEACTPLGIVLHDHLIVGRNKVSSFKAQDIL